MQMKILSVERRCRWNYEDKVRLVEETLQAGETVCGVARRHGLAASLLFSWRRQAREGRLGGGGLAGFGSCRDHFCAGFGIDMRAATAVFACCAADKDRNNRD
jgi:transposase